MTTITLQQPPDEWQRRLPGFNKDRDTNRIQIYARFQNTSAKVYFYVAEARQIGDVWLYYGFAIVPTQSFPLQLTVSARELETGNWRGGAVCELDKTFTTGPWLMYKKVHFPPKPLDRSGRADGRRRDYDRNRKLQ